MSRILSIPGHEPGRTGSMVELLDIYPTLSELAGLKSPAAVQGVSLVPILKGPSATVKEGAISFAKGTAWRTGNWAYMRYRDGSEELYDMNEDPGQITNLARDPKHASTRKQMSAALDARLKSASAKTP